MRKRKDGQIVNISSIGVQTNAPRFSAYVASKAALDAFSRSIASEVVADGVCITTVYMPLVRTPMIAPTKMYEAVPTRSPDEAVDMIVDGIVNRKKRVATRLGVFGEVSYALAPSSSTASSTPASACSPNRHARARRGIHRPPDPRPSRSHTSCTGFTGRTTDDIPRGTYRPAGRERVRVHLATRRLLYELRVSHGGHRREHDQGQVLRPRDRAADARRSVGLRPRPLEPNLPSDVPCRRGGGRTAVRRVHAMGGRLCGRVLVQEWGRGASARWSQRWAWRLGLLRSNSDLSRVFATPSNPPDPR